MSRHGPCVSMTLVSLHSPNSREHLLINHTEKLRELGVEMCPGDQEVLLRFLTENLGAPGAIRSSNDRLLEILKRNLAEPKPREQWAHLVAGNRSVQVVTAREHVWTMSTTAVKLSDEVFVSWVTRARDLMGISKDPSFRVWTL